MAAATSSELAPFPFHRKRQSGVFSTNTSLVFREEATGFTWESEAQGQGGVEPSATEQHFMHIQTETDLHRSGGVGAALADVEEPCAAGLGLSTLTGRPTQVDDQGLVLKQAHKMGGFLTLSDTNLQRHSHTHRVCRRMLLCVLVNQQPGPGSLSSECGSLYAKLTADVSEDNRLM